MPCEQAQDMTPFQIFRQVSRYAIAHQPQPCVISLTFPAIRIMFDGQLDHVKRLFLLEPNGIWQMQYRHHQTPHIVIVGVHVEPLMVNDAGVQDKLMLPRGPHLVLTNYRNLDDFVSGIDQAVRGSRHG